MALAELDRFRTLVRQQKEEVAAVPLRITAAADIPWAGRAARAWRERMDEFRREVWRTDSHLDELLGRLEHLRHRLEEQGATHG